MVGPLRVEVERIKSVIQPSAVCLGVSLCVITAVSGVRVQSCLEILHVHLKTNWKEVFHLKGKVFNSLGP